ncbi:unnamed protein product [Parajaminaea phylloscopi]
MLLKVIFFLVAAFAASACARISSVQVKGPVKSKASHIPVTFNTNNYITNNKQYSAVYGVSPAGSQVYPGTAGKYLLPNATDLTNLPGLHASTTYKVPFKLDVPAGNYSLLVSTFESVGASNEIFIANHTTSFVVQ